MASAHPPRASTSSTNVHGDSVGDPLGLLDFSQFDGYQPYQPSASVSPSEAKSHFRKPSTTMATAAAIPSGQQMSGPSHQYDQYQQQTPFVPGALASTLALNQNSQHLGYTLDYMPSDTFFDFNATPSQTNMTSSDMDLDFDPPGDSAFFYDTTVNSDAIGGQEQTLASPPTRSNVGRMYPGMHQQQALEKAQAQKQQQQQLMAQQNQQGQQQPSKQQRTKPGQPSDPIVEQKISQLLNSMRQKPSGLEDQSSSPLMNFPRSRKEEDEMDDDERLLASEEGKKLSSKERRQLRNKVSARAFRSRRKEYITQLEAEIATKINENGDLRAQNRALIEENRRLSGLTRTLLGSPSFTNFLEHLSINPAPVASQSQQAAPKTEQRQQPPRQVPKDINPYHVQSQQQIGLAMIPESSMDFSMSNTDTNDAYSFQPQVYTAVVPEMPEIDVSVLCEKRKQLYSMDKPGTASCALPLSCRQRPSVLTSSASYSPGFRAYVYDTEEEVKQWDNAKTEPVPIVPFEVPSRLEVAKSLVPEAPTADCTARRVMDLDTDLLDDDGNECVLPVMGDINSPSTGGVERPWDMGGRRAILRSEAEEALEEDTVSEALMVRINRITASLPARMARLGLWTSEP